MKFLNTNLACLITLLMEFGQPIDYVTSMELELSGSAMAFNVPETSRTYSSVYNDGMLGHKLSMIDSNNGWISNLLPGGDWMLIDLGSEKEFDGL